MMNRPGLSALALCLLTACAPPRVIYEPAAVSVSREQVPVEVYLHGGEHMTVGEARVTGDTLYGRLENDSQLVEPERGDPPGVHRADHAFGARPEPRLVMRRTFMLLFALGATTGCRLTTVYQPAGELVAAERDPLRVELLDGQSYVIGQARVVRDTLHGTVLSTSTQAKLPMDSVRRITHEVPEWHPSVARGLGFAAGLVFGFLVAGSLVL